MTFAMTLLKRIELAFTLALLKVLFSKYKLLSYVVRRKKTKKRGKKMKFFLLELTCIGLCIATGGFYLLVGLSMDSATCFQGGLKGENRSNLPVVFSKDAFTN